jgi:glycosyltransferase involved in cell wall biosynthesis
MRVAISTSVIQRGRTGVAQYVFGLVRALCARAREHEFVLLALEEDVPLFDFARDAMRIEPVPERFRPAIRNILWHQITLPGIVRRMGVDVLHVPSYRRMLWSKPCALVSTIHDLAQFHVQAKYDIARMFYGRVIVRQLAHRQDQIVTISHNTARDIERFFRIPEARQNVIYNGIDHERFRPADPDGAGLEAGQAWGLDAPFVLYVSRLEHPGKNHVRLIRAFDRFKDATGSDWLLALGGADWHGADVIRAAAAGSRHARDIRFLGFVEDRRLPQLYQSARALVYPSLYEGFGLPPVEAMACGCPVISSTRGALKEVVGGAAEVVDPENVEDIARALQVVAADPGRTGQLRRAGLENARRFDWSSNAARMIEVYSKAARTDGGRRRGG